jgi:hypothetical protein
MCQYPVVVYAHGSGGDLLDDGTALRQIAELGLATISLDYDQTNESVFAAQWGVVLQHLGRQSWTQTNAVAWVGFGLGADRLLEFSLRHPERQPQLLVWLSGTGQRPAQTNGYGISSHATILLVHGQGNQAVPLANTERLASFLQANGLTMEQKAVSNTSYDMESEQGVVFRLVGEYCRTHLTGQDDWEHYHSMTQWQAGSVPLWLLWLPAAVWALGWMWRSQYCKGAPSEQIKLSRSEIVLRWLAALLATWTLAVTAIHLATPCYPVGSTTSSIARRFLVQPKELTDFEYLAAQPIWRGQRLKTLLDHVESVGYTRKTVNWQLDDKMYWDFVLSPVITGNAGEQLNWRRRLWEEYYPLTRRESSPEDAARVVVRHLRERITVAKSPNLPRDVPTILLRQITDEVGFEVIYVAALRSVGVPARLDPGGHASLWRDDKWEPAPRPSILRL